MLKHPFCFTLIIVRQKYKIVKFFAELYSLKGNEMTEVIIIVSVFAAIAVFFMYASKSGAKLLKQRDEKLSRAQKGRAKIIGCSPVGMSGTGSGGEIPGL